MRPGLSQSARTSWHLVNSCGSSDDSVPTSSIRTIPNRGSTDASLHEPPGSAAWSTPCTASMPALRIPFREGRSCTPSNARPRSAREPNSSRIPKILRCYDDSACRTASSCCSGTGSSWSASIPEPMTTVADRPGAISASTRTPLSWAWWRVSCGRRVSVSSSRRPRGCVTGTPSWCSSSSVVQILRKPMPSLRRTSPPPVAAGASSSLATGTRWSASTPPSTSSCCRPTAKVSPEQPWKRPPAGSR